MLKTEATWNNMQLERPPNATWQVEARKFDTQRFLATIDKVIQDLDSQEMLHMEAAILSRLIYRMKSKFRNDKGLKNMSKVNKALLKYLSLSLEKEFKNLRSFVELDRKFVRLPSRQMVEYLLVKTQGFAQLMLRVEEVASHCAYCFKSRLNLGHAWGIAVVAYAVISRIWILARYLIKQSCSWYNSLYEHLKLFKVLGIPWLPKNYYLPSDLKSWLSLPWIDDAIPSIPTNEELKDSMFRLITEQEFDSNKESDIKESGTISSSLSMHKQYNVPSKGVKDANVSIITMDDTGEAINRHTFDMKRIEEKGNKFNANKWTLTETIEEEDERKKYMRVMESGKKKEVNITETFSQNEKNEINKKHDKDFTTKSDTPLKIDDVKSKSELTLILSKKSYPGLDKLQWKMIRKKGKKLLDTLNVCPDENKQTVLMKKLIHRIQRWIS